MLIDRDGLCALIPHAGAMCLLSGVMSWNATQITCLAHSHRDPANPLAHNGRLPALCGIEYAAQAIAAHGALNKLVEQRPRAGLLVSVRDVISHLPYLSDIAADLMVEAEQLAAGAGGASYRFALRADGQELLNGRATVVLDAEAL